MATAKEIKKSLDEDPRKTWLSIEDFQKFNIWPGRCPLAILTSASPVAPCAAVPTTLSMALSTLIWLRQRCQVLQLLDKQRHRGWFLLTPACSSPG